MYRLMIVDDDSNVLAALRRSLSRKQGDGSTLYQVETFDMPQAALARLQDCAFDVVLSDFRMPIMDGVEFLSQVKAQQPNAMRLILSGYTDLDGLIGAINQAHIFRFLAKPWHEYELLTAIEQALEYRFLQMENQRLADQVRVEQGKLSRHEAELRRLEAESPGITRVNWGPDGSVMFDQIEPGDVDEDDLNKFFQSNEARS